MLIINADDYGMNSQINKAIAYCFRNVLCTSATIMSNMPGFEEACVLGIENKFSEYIGMHLVLNEGFPLSEKIRNIDKFCTKDGLLCFSRKYPTIFLSASEKHALGEEIRAQIQRCRKNGIKISHIDSHHHVHTEWGIANVLIPIAKEEGIGYIRIARNCIKSSNKIKDLYKTIFNYFLKLNKLSATKYFGSLEEFFICCKNRNISKDIFEIMIHPHFIGNDLYLSGNIDETYYVKTIEKYRNDWNTISFGDIKAYNL